MSGLPGCMLPAKIVCTPRTFGYVREVCVKRDGSACAAISLHTNFSNVLWYYKGRSVGQLCGILSGWILTNEVSLMSNGLSNDELQLSREEMQALGYQVIDMLIEHFEHLREEPLTRKANRATLEERLREPLPEQGTGVEDVFRQLERDIFSN